MEAVLEIAQSNTSHVRARSLPCGNHPLITSVEDQLQRLTSLVKASSSCQKLEELKNLHECVNDMLLITCTQQAISCETHNEILDGSLRLLELCGSTRDVFSQMKECLRDLELSLRRSRRFGDNSTMMNEIESFMSSRKQLSKYTSKLLKDIKKMKKDMKNSEDMAVVRVLKEVERFSIQNFESLLLLNVAQPVTRSKANGLSLVPNPFKSKRASLEFEEDSKVKEMENLDMELTDLIKGKKSSKVQFLLKRLVTLEFSVQELEEDLECVYRCLLKTRVSLLNGLKQ